MFRPKRKLYRDPFSTKLIFILLLIFYLKFNGWTKMKALGHVLRFQFTIDLKIQFSNFVFSCSYTYVTSFTEDKVLHGACHVLAWLFWYMRFLDLYKSNFLIHNEIFFLSFFFYKSRPNCSPTFCLTVKIILTKTWICGGQCGPWDIPLLIWKIFRKFSDPAIIHNL